MNALIDTYLTSIVPTSAVVAAWLLTVAMHSSIFLGVAWIVDRLLQRKADVLRGGSWRESLWRAALFGGALTASLQLATGLPMLARPWQLVPVAMPAVEVATSAAPAPSNAAAVSSAPTSMHPVPTTAAKPDAVPANRLLMERVVSPAQSLRESGARTDGASGAGARWIASSPAWATSLVCAWAAGALIALARVLRNLVALRGVLAGAEPIVGEAANDDAEALALQARSAAPRIFSLDALESPLATSRARIVLPIWAISTLDRAQLRAMLAHEVAHLSRFDPEWRLLVAVWLALFWFVPFGRLAQRRLDEIAELACDAFAARAVGNGRDLAECLAACAERHERSPAFVFATAMAVRESSFIQRIEQLLEGTNIMHPQTKIRAAIARALTLCALLAGAVCLPGIGLMPRAVHAAQAAPQPSQTPPSAAQSSSAQSPQPTARRHAQDDSHISIHGDDGSQSTTISYSDGEYKFNASIKGNITFTADESDVATLSAGGRATFEETRGGVSQRVEITERSGKLERRYFVNGSEQPWNDAARTWLAKLVIDVERSGLGAEAREQHLYAQGGAKRVLDEIAQIHSDYARSAYLKLLLAHGKLEPADLDRAMKLAGEAQSDYERRQQLQAIFRTQPLDAERQITFLQQATHFDSDYERAELLVEIAPTLADRADVRQAWLDAALRLQSDYERRRTLTTMLDRPGLDDAQLASVIKASASMGSDYERRELLVAAIRRARDVEALAPLYVSSVQDLGSDYERREALFALIRSGRLGPAGTGAVLDATAKIGSSYERREVLVELARNILPTDAASRDHYHKVAAGLDASDRKEAEGALQL